MMDYYKILGVSSQTSDKEIKSAYRKLAKQYHPDAVKDNQELTEKMYEIQAAYEVLGDEDKRKKYDADLLKEKNISNHRRADMADAVKNPNMTQFEHFFGFQAGKGMETYHGKQTGAAKKDGPMNPDDLFAAYFGKRKQ